ncbi:MAG: gamma-glutamyl-gamma-aminobutyrate hydrolase family protein, partial [Clostridiales bacterium]|nr:gamma-glutamyl-gamma-aminobutyrate hydrolase family protein [Clostridiales bacterium]
MVTVAIPQMGSDLFRKYMKSKYSKSLETAGAVPVWIELDDIDFAVSEALKCCGLLLPGGADVNPNLYNQAPAAACGKPNEKRDFAEPKILDAFLKTGKPIFGICRGIQILNVCLGGNLIQDIKPAQKHNHSDFLHRARTTHSVIINKNSKLYSVLREDSLMVNSI